MTGNEILDFINTVSQIKAEKLHVEEPSAWAKSSSAVHTDDGESYVPVGINGLLASTEKLLAVNRGVIPTDQRDSLEFKRVMTPAALMSERVKFDASKNRRKLMMLASRRKTLQGAHPFMFDGDVEGLLVSNPLSSPLEEINTMHLADQRRRITMMGPGGIGSPDAITQSMQAVHPSQFGFICPLSGPECFPDNYEVLTKEGWRRWRDLGDSVADDLRLACWVNEQLEFHQPSRLIQSPFNGSLYGLHDGALFFEVTPNHRMFVDLVEMEGWFPQLVEMADIYNQPYKISTDMEGRPSGIRSIASSSYRTVRSFTGMVSCATVPGSLLYCRAEGCLQGFWSGNSERAGVDVRLAWGAKIGTDGRIYQRFKNARTKNIEWKSSKDIADKVVEMPP